MVAVALTETFYQPLIPPLTLNGVTREGPCQLVRLVRVVELVKQHLIMAGHFEWSYKEGALSTGTTRYESCKW